MVKNSKNKKIGIDLIILILGFISLILGLVQGKSNNAIIGISGFILLWGIFIIMMLIDAIKTKNLRWFLLMLITPPIGAILYYMFIKK